MRKIQLFVVAILITFAACKSSKTGNTAKKQETVYTVGGVPMYLDEFSYVFNKNKNLNNYIP